MRAASATSVSSLAKEWADSHARCEYHVTCVLRFCSRRLPGDKRVDTPGRSRAFVASYVTHAIGSALATSPLGRHGRYPRHCQCLRRPAGVLRELWVLFLDERYS